jgi:hypothetical protein
VKIGDRLRAFARSFCTAETMERIIDPLIADLRFEHATAHRAGRQWQARWRRIMGYVSFWRTLGMCATRSSVEKSRAWAAADGHAMGRTAGYSCAIIAVLMVLLALLPFYAVADHVNPHEFGKLFVYVLPQAIPIAVVFGLPMGILVALRGRPVTRRIGWSVLAITVVWMAITFSVCAWLLPETNQLFRETVVGRGRSTGLARGANELTFRELTARLAALKSTAGVEARAYVFSFHARMAAAVAPVIWGIFALSMASVTRRTLLSTTIFVLAAITYIAYATFVIAGGTVTFFWLPIAYVIWLPNVLFALMTVVVYAASWESRPPEGPARAGRPI